MRLPEAFKGSLGTLAHIGNKKTPEGVPLRSFYVHVTTYSRCGLYAYRYTCRLQRTCGVQEPWVLRPPCQT